MYKLTLQNRTIDFLKFELICGCFFICMIRDKNTLSPNNFDYLLYFYRVRHSVALYHCYRE